MNFVFIRHSKTDRNPKVPYICWGLADEGIVLANKLAGDEVIKNLDVIYSSFQTKALETAVLLAKPNAIPIKADNRLTEVTSFTGRYEPDFEIYTKNVHDFYFDLVQRIDNGESKDEALSRFYEALKEIATDETENQNIGIVSHGNILALFSEKYSNVSAFELHSKIKQPDLAIFNWDKKQFSVFW